MDPTRLRYRWVRWVALMSLLLSVAAFSWPTWLERWIGDRADGGDGTIEYALAVGFALAAAGLIVLPLQAARRARCARMEARHGS